MRGLAGRLRRMSVRFTPRSQQVQRPAATCGGPEPRGPLDSRAPGGGRTHTERFLRPLPLPIGIPGRRTATAGVGLKVGLAWVDRVRTRGAVEEEQASAVVDLVLERPRFESLALEDHLRTGAGLPPADDQAGCALHVTGQVRHAHAPLP